MNTCEKMDLWPTPVSAVGWGTPNHPEVSASKPANALLLFCNHSVLHYFYVLCSEGGTTPPILVTRGKKHQLLIFFLIIWIFFLFLLENFKPPIHTTTPLHITAIAAHRPLRSVLAAGCCVRCNCYFYHCLPLGWCFSKVILLIRLRGIGRNWRAGLCEGLSFVLGLSFVFPLFFFCFCWRPWCWLGFVFVGVAV